MILMVGKRFVLVFFLGSVWSDINFSCLVSSLHKANSAWVRRSEAQRASLRQLWTEIAHRHMVVRSLLFSEDKQVAVNFFSLWPAVESMLQSISQIAWSWRTSKSSFHTVVKLHLQWWVIEGEVIEVWQKFWVFSVIFALPTVSSSVSVQLSAICHCSVKFHVHKRENGHPGRYL